MGCVAPFDRFREVQTGSENWSNLAKDRQLLRGRSSWGLNSGSNSTALLLTAVLFTFQLSSLSTKNAYCGICHFLFKTCHLKLAVCIAKA